MFDVPVQKMQKTADAISASRLIIFLILFFSVKILMAVSTIKSTENRLLKIAVYESIERIHC